MNTAPPILTRLPRTLYFEDDRLFLLDQRLLPEFVQYIDVSNTDEVADAIAGMVVRGAPAIGIAGAYGVALAAGQALRQEASLTEAVVQVRQQAQTLSQARPTAVNLQWAVECQLVALQRWLASQLRHEATTPQLYEMLLAEARRLHQTDIDANMTIGRYGRPLIPLGGRVLTHCNAGALATGGFGTALGVIRTAFAEDASLHVYANETRPRLQGARLTAWELVQEGIPVTVLTDGMCGHVMARGMIDVVIVGADRIAANGDTANKIGTYTVALAAHAHGIPLYVAAPASTFDLSLSTGAEIPIEERDWEEMRQVGGALLCPTPGVSFFNPAFDVTPGDLIAGFITEAGILRPPYAKTLTESLPGQ